MSHSDVKSASGSKPSSPTSPTSPDVINQAATKLCHIVKRPDFDGYGFNLHSEKAKPGQFIGKVDADSPAEAAGLKEGDRIIEVNGTPINSESHKQVVQRIKAIACEVRLLLVDVDGKGDGHASNGHCNNNIVLSKTEQVLPGASENINSITMVSTKRSSQESQRSSSSTLPAGPAATAAAANGHGKDVTDKALPPSPQDDKHMIMTNNNNNNNIPPPPSATMASMQKMENGNGTVGPNSGNNSIKAGSLQLPMTAAEMRAKLLSKKKYDPKNESVDLKKKFEIVQKL